jgi:hypothetical protein
MQPRRITIVIGVATLLCSGFFVTGCAKKSSQKPAPKPNKTDKAQQSIKDNPDIHAEIGSFNAVLPDGNGRPWVAVSGVASAKLFTDPSGNRNATSTIKGTKALIYKNGNPAFTIEAPLIIADQKTARVTASGGVYAVSIFDDATAERKLASDTMIWEMRRSTLVGKGNVSLYDGRGFEIPAASFKADGTLERIDIYTDEKPVSGWWK